MVNGFIVYPAYDESNGVTQVKLYGRLENGESFVTINEIEPYFFVSELYSKRIEKLCASYEAVIEKTKLTDFAEASVIKIICKSQANMNKLVKEVHEEKIDTFEADIKPQYRFIIDNNLLGKIEIEGEYDSSERVNRVYKNPVVKAPKSGIEIKLKVASVDIETNKKGDKLFCIGISSKNYKKNFMITKEKLEHTVSCEDEEECLKQFKRELIEIDPDIITGWNVIGFDFNFLKERFAKHKVSFDLGRDESNSKIRIEGNFFRNSSMDIEGRLVLDGMNFIKDPFIQEAPSIKNIEFENYTLETISQAIIGKGKMITSKNRGDEIEELYENNQQKLADYNLRDCELVYEILEKTNMIELSIERSELTGMPLDRITASIASFDSLYIREARKRNLVSPTTKFSNKEEKIKGGFVMSPKSGLYHNVLVLDFKSLYPSIIRTFNIDPSSFVINPEKKENNLIVSPNGAYFKNQDGILPMIIETLHQAREKAKKEKRELSSYAIKIIMNSFFGVLASPNCRYFDLKMANAITNFGQEIIKLTTKKIEELGYEVIYGDTDSVFVHTKLEKDKAKELGTKISEIIDEFYKDYVKTTFNRTSYLDLEFDKLYSALIFPQIRMHETKKPKTNEEEEQGARGAKKRYAGLIEENGKEELDIVGLEAIRGDWTEAAKEFQRNLLLKTFKNENPAAYIKEFVKDLTSGRLDKKLVYRKSIRKELIEYTKITPPHVKAARQLDSLEGNVIEYYITVTGPEPVQKLRHKLDYEHYLEKQIKPIAKTILETLGINFEELLSQTKQRTLF